MKLSLIPDTDIRLSKPSEAVTRFDSELSEFCEALKQLMIDSKGCGIAAPQVGIMKRIIVVEYEEGKYEILINPVLINSSGESINLEGCLSFPNVMVEITRKSHVVVDYLATNGDPCSWELDDFTAIIVQHEIDHLDGITMRNHVSRLKWERAKKKAAG